MTAQQTPGRLARSARFCLRWLPRLGLLALAAGVAAYFCFPFREGRLRESQGNGALQVLDRAGGIIGWHVGKDDCWRLPVPLREIPSKFLAATIAAEDKRFYDHQGVDFLALARAVRQNLTHVRRVSGASTLTMQTIRLLYPRPRTYLVKMREALAALQLEKIADKARILETYCNLAPYGGNVIGVQAAALRYFGKNAADLTLGEAALLAGVPQSPSRFNPRKHLEAALKRREFVLDRMTALKMITPEDAARARAEKIILARPEENAAAAVPGLTAWIARAHPSGGVRRAAIDPAAQAAASGAAARHFRRLRAAGVNGLAVVVVNVKKSELAALVGNAAPDDPQCGRLNGALIRRPPGSLLKPFIYALAYQRGVCLPESPVDDSPRAWDGYRPENMDRKFLGEIPAAEALRLSRNIPAVAMLEAAGRENTAALLRALGLDVPDTGRLGLSLALGTPEMRLADLTNAYAALARLGEWRELHLLADEKNAAPDASAARAHLTPAAAWLALKSLAPDGEEPSRVWKTGTSWHHRDAWAVAVSPEYAVGVWAGNWGGAADGRLAGATDALPLAREILLLLSRGPGWERPAGLQETSLCAVSGCRPGIHCRKRQSAFAIPGVSPETVCGRCRPAAPETPEIPAAPAKKLAVLSPGPGTEYVLAPGAPGELPWQAELPGGGQAEIVWFLDGREAARTRPGVVFRWPMRPGAHALTAVAPDGETVKIGFAVKALSSEF